VGSAVHSGLAVLLQAASVVPGAHNDLMAMAAFEQDAVNAALADFAQYAGHLDLDLAESTALAQPGASLGDHLAASLGMSPEDAGLGELTERVGRARSEFDQFLYVEQSALVEAMVRAYARRRLRPLLEQFEVLEVEREGEWLLSQWETNASLLGPEFEGWCNCGHSHDLHASGAPYACTVLMCECEAYDKDITSLWFMSRPDALLLERDTRQLYLLSFKTAATWDIRKERDAQHDMQGLSEGVEVERRLANAWTALRKEVVMDRGDLTLEVCKAYDLKPATANFLFASPAPPRIHAIRYEFMLKGPRRRDKDLSQRLSLDAYSQASHLVRAYYSPGMTSADEQWNWSWQYLKPGGETSNLYYKAWKAAPVWEHMPIRAWIDRLDAHVETMGEEGSSLGWTGPAQATGGTSEHPLDSVFLPPLVIYRNDDDLRDWLEQTEAQERRVAEGVAAVQAAGDEGERRHLLNIHFEQHRKECVYPSPCQFEKICYGGESLRADPLGSGLFELRVPNHPVELSKP
jgi:hypothetical protein